MTPNDEIPSYVSNCPLVLGNLGLTLTKACGLLPININTSRSLVTVAWHIWRAAANTLNTQLKTNDKE